MMTEWEIRTSKQAIWNQIHRPFIEWETGHKFFGCGVWAEPMIAEWEQGDRPGNLFGALVTFLITDEDVERWPEIAGTCPDGTAVFGLSPNEVRPYNQAPATLETMGLE